VIDSNEIFPMLRSSQDQGLLRNVQADLRDRIGFLGTAKLAPQGARQEEPHVQPSLETGAGGERAMPLTGPGPAPNLLQDVFVLADANQKREEAQKASMRGPGPDPTRVQVGPVPAEKVKQADKVATETTRQALEKAREATGAQAPPPEAPGGGPQERQGAQPPEPPPGGSEQPREKGGGALDAAQPPQANQPPAPAAGPAKPPEGAGGPKPPPQPAAPQKAQPGGKPGDQKGDQPVKSFVGDTPHERAVLERSGNEGFAGAPSQRDRLPGQIAPQVIAQQGGTPGEQRTQQAARPAGKPARAGARPPARA
jgi:hypothetical protein